MKKLEGVKKIAQKCLKCENPLCSKACPLNNPIPLILELIQNDKIEEAKTLLFNNSNATFICSKLCDFKKNCYGNCVLNKKGTPVPFYEVEEYLSSFYSDKYLIKDHKLDGLKIIIFGAGLSGISFAIDASRFGADVTLVEKENRIGGVLYTMLPRFRFDDSVISVYEEILNNLGVKVELNKEFGKDYLIEDTKEYDLCIFANGLDKFKNTLGDSKYLLKSDQILKLAKENKYLIKDKKVLVIGGGNVAMDVARTLNNSNNNVHIVYRRNIENAAASQKEIADAINEGVIFKECVAPVSMNFDCDVLKSLTVEKMNLVDDGSARLNFVKTGIYEEIFCDYIVEAIGQNGDYEYLKKNLPNLFDESGWIKEEGIKENNTFYFATGDYLTGASSFSNATSVSNKIIRKVIEKLC